jgi:hypothetical protein
VDVLDDQLHDDSDQAWQDDNVALFVDGDRVANDVASFQQIGSEGFGLLMDIGGDVVSVGLNFGTDWFASATTYPGGRIVEFRVPLTSIDTEDGPGMTPAGVGATIGWNITAGDDDNGGEPFESPDDSYGAWAGSYDNWLWNRESDWGRLFFSPTDALRVAPAGQALSLSGTDFMEAPAPRAAQRRVVDQSRPGRVHGHFLRWWIQ